MQDMDNLSSRRTSLQLSGLLVVLVIFFHSTVLSLVGRWLKFDQSLSHGLPTAAIFIFLLWRITAKHGEHDSSVTHWLTSITLGLLSICWYLFESINIQLASAGLLLALFTFYIASSFSLATARQLLPLIAMFLFTIPMWGELTDSLVELSSLIVGKLVDLIGITVIIEGNNILIPSGIIQIAEGCSGLRYLTISLLLAYIVCLLNGYNLRQSTIAMAIATFLGLLTNWIRIVTLVIIGYQTNMQSPLMHDHETFGWILFAVIILPALYFAPFVQKHINFDISVPKFKPLIPTLFLVIGPVLLFLTEKNANYTNHLTLDGFELQKKPAKNSNAAILALPETIAVSEGEISINNIDIALTLAKSIAPPADKKLVPYIGNLFDRGVWVTEEERKIEIHKESFTFLKLKSINSSRKSLLMFQFNVGNSASSSYRHAKLLQLQARLLGEDFFGLLLMQVSCKLDCNEETVALEKAAEQWHQLKLSSNPRLL
jgi:exosortase